MTVREFDAIGMLRRHARMIALLCLSSVVQVVLLTFLLSDKYHASTLVLITPQRETALANAPDSKQLLNFPVSTVGVSTQTETSTKTYGELIKSRPVMERVVRSLGLDQPGEESGSALEGIQESLKTLVAQAWEILQYGRVVEGNAFDDAVSELSARIAIAPTRNSYVFAIEALWPDPNAAAAIANELAAAFVGLLAEISESQATGLRQFVARRLVQAETQVAVARAALQDFKEMNRTIAFDEETAEEIKLIAKLEASLETTNSRLSGERAQFSIDGAGRASTPRARALEAERDRLARSIAERKAELIELPLAEAELATLELDLRAAEEIYHLVSREHESARIREAQRTSDIRIVAPALVPARPVKPIKIYYVVVALLLSLVAGIGLAVVVEVADPTLRSVEDVERALGVPVLGTLPELPGSDGEGR